MKFKIIIFIILSFAFVSGMGQISEKLFFNEINISVNRTTLKNDNTQNRTGFGLGVYRSFWPQKTINLVFGMEYNHTGQFKKLMYQGRFASATDVTYRLDLISVLLGARCNVGKSIRFFVEAGGFADLVACSRAKGTMHIHSFDGSGQSTSINKDFDEKAGLFSYVGVYAAAGISIPVSKTELIIKPMYKYGLTKLYSGYENMYNRYLSLSMGLRAR